MKRVTDGCKLFVVCVPKGSRDGIQKQGQDGQDSFDRDSAAEYIHNHHSYIKQAVMKSFQVTASSCLSTMRPPDAVGRIPSGAPPFPALFRKY